MKKVQLILVMFFTLNGIAKADYPDFIPIENSPAKNISSNNFSSIYLGSHESNIENLMMVGAGIRDRSNGNVAGFACVGIEQDSTQPSCKIIRKFYLSAKTNKLYFFDEAFFNPENPTTKELKKTVKYAMFYNSLSNDASNNRGAPAGSRIRGNQFKPTLTQASLNNRGWNWGDDQDEVSHQAFGYFVGHFGNGLKWHGIQE
jgi:hypothetical protein